MPLRVLLIAGETSGDLHGAGVVRELKKRVPHADVFGVGGDRMQQEGMELVFHVSRLSFMGFVEVLKNLSIIKEVEGTLVHLLHTRRPDVVVLIDYPGFNLRFARQAKAAGLKVLYYISPQVWAWHGSRVRKMVGVVDSMKVVFPFEVALYQKEGIPVEFVGHPLAESIGSSMHRKGFFERHGFDDTQKVLALFPGSRKQEIERILPVMAEAALRLMREQPLHVVVGVAPGINPRGMEHLVPHELVCRYLTEETYDLMNHADAAIVTSGTATLETGWFGTPMVVVYKTSPVTYFIGRILVDVKHIGLVNIVAGKGVVPELIQYRMTPSRLAESVRPMLYNSEVNARIRRELGVIRSRLGEKGASRKVVDGILQLAGSV